MRCPVCGWADAGELHVRLHLQSEITRLRKANEWLKAELETASKRRSEGMSRPIKRFVRGFVAALAAAGALYGAQYLGDSPVLDGVLGIGWSAVIAGALMAVGKFVREKYGVDLTP